MACDHGMMLMSDHDDAYVDAMLMVNMQANTRSVTTSLRIMNLAEDESTTRSPLNYGEAIMVLPGTDSNEN